MTLDERARLAVEDIQLAVDRLERETRGPLERFDRYRDRRQRNRRLTAGALAAIVALGALLFALRALQPDRSVPATPVVPTGVLLVGDWNPKGQEATWSTVSADGSQRTDLGFRATCARWAPTGDRILITNDTAIPTDRAAAASRDSSSRDGTGLVPLDGLTDPGLNLGCGDMSPDGSLLAVEGWVKHAPSRNGIYEVSASDGNGLIRLTEGHDSVPVYSPDGTQVAFFRTKVGINPDGAGAIFVVNTNGSGLHRVTPWGWAFLHESWSPDGLWIAFQKPYGELYVVHRTGPACIRCRSRYRQAWERWTPSGRPTARGSCSPRKRRTRRDLGGASRRVGVATNRGRTRRTALAARLAPVARRNLESERAASAASMGADGPTAAARSRDARVRPAEPRGARHARVRRRARGRASSSILASRHPEDGRGRRDRAVGRLLHALQPDERRRPASDAEQPDRPRRPYRGDRRGSGGHDRRLPPRAARTACPAVRSARRRRRPLLDRPRVRRRADRRARRRVHRFPARAHPRAGPGARPAARRPLEGLARRLDLA